MSDRLRCVNPNCRRTAAQEKFPESDSICCAKCWKLLPKKFVDRYKELARRQRKFHRKIMKLQAQGDFNHATPVHEAEYALSHMIYENWQQIRNFFVEPDGPMGLDRFLKETGL